MVKIKQKIKNNIKYFHFLIKKILLKQKSKVNEKLARIDKGKRRKFT